jgi:excisionase family DNA binding protein
VTTEEEDQTMNPTTDEVLTVDEVAAALRVPRENVLRAIRKGELRAKKFGNRGGYRIRRVDYEEWLATPTPRKPTRQEVEDLANIIRAELARTPALAYITVKQVVDNPVDSQNPRGWSVQLLDARTSNLPTYVSTYQEWEAVKTQLLPRPKTAEEIEEANQVYRETERKWKSGMGLTE